MRIRTVRARKPRVLVKPPLIALPQSVEYPVEEGGKPARLGPGRFQQARTHHRRQGERDDAGDDDRTREGEREFAKQRAGQTGDKANWRIDRGKRDRHRNHRRGDLVRALQGRVARGHPLFHVAIDIFNDDDRVVHDETDRQHEREQGQEVQRIAKREKNCHHADERKRNGHDRDNRRAQIAEEKENHHDDDQRRFAKRLFDFSDRGTDEFRRVIGDGGVEPGGKLRLEFRKSLADIVDHIEGVRRRGRVNADEDSLETFESGGRIDRLRAEFDIGYVAEPYQRVAACRDDQLAEGLRGIERGLGIDAGLDEIALDLARRGREIVGGQGGRDIGWASRRARPSGSD